MNTGQVVELFEGGWLELGEGLPQVRVIVARHRAPAPGKGIAVGKRVGEWVYELFITMDADDSSALDLNLPDSAPVVFTPIEGGWVAAGTPGLSGIPKVATPEPARASRPSEWPW